MRNSLITLVNNMSVPPDKLMQLMKGQRGTPATVGGAPSMPIDSGAMTDAQTPPMGSPMSTPEPKMGNKEGAMVNLSMAMDLIEQSLPAIGSETEEGQKLLAAVRALTGVLGPRKEKSRELQQSEILQLLQNLPQAGGGTPEGRAMAQAPAVPNLPPMPGAGPGGTPTPA